LIIAEDIDNEALATLIVNKMRGTMKVCAVKAPDFGDRRKLVLDDIAITTGGQVFDKQKGMKLDKFSWEWFGEARTVTVEKEQTTIVDGKGTVESIETRVEELQQQIDKATTPFEVEKLQERLAKFVGGVAIIHVGGNTETEMREKKDRVDDALHATRAAVQEGIVPGGGIALVRCIDKLENIIVDNEDQNTGINIIKSALEAPLRTIVKNAGGEDSVVLQKVKLGKGDFGFNARTGNFENLYEAGVIDPTKVTRLALENAASIASLLLTTECVVSETEDNNSSNNTPPSMGGGMGNMM
jgi:chaperonin GroEL